MHSGRYIFGLGRYYTVQEGSPIPVEQRDVFSTLEKSIDCENEGIHILWAKCLTYDNEGVVSDGERVDIYASDVAAVMEKQLVYRGVLTKSRVVETYLYIPNEWATKLENLAREEGIVE